VLLGYFQQCPQIKFALASPQCLQELFDYLKQAEAKTQETAVAGYTPKPLPAKTIISEPPGAVAPPAIASAARTGERTPAASIVMPPGAKPPAAAATAAPPATATAISGPAPAGCGSPVLTQEDIAHLINILAVEIQRLVQQRTRRSL
jgi:hypothetical protein